MFIILAFVNLGSIGYGKDSRIWMIIERVKLDTYSYLTNLYPVDPNLIEIKVGMRINFIFNLGDWSKAKIIKTLPFPPSTHAILYK